MTLFWFILGLLLVIAILAVIRPFIFGKTADFRRYRYVLGALVAAVGVGSVSFYTMTGTPGYVANPPEPLVSPEVLAMVRQLEDVMEQNPNDPEGWMILGRAYARMGRVDMATQAYRNVLALDPGNTTASAALGGLLIASSGGQVPPEAMNLFETIVDRGVMQPMAFYYLGLGHVQQGNDAAAYDVWSELAEMSPPGAPWNDMLRGELTRLSRDLGRPMPNLPPPQPEQ